MTNGPCIAVLSDVHGNVSWTGRLGGRAGDDPLSLEGSREAARRNGRPDWAEWIETGRARLP